MKNLLIEQWFLNRSSGSKSTETTARVFFKFYYHRAMSEGKWEVVKSASKHHPRKNAERKQKKQQQQQEDDFVAQQQPKDVMTPALAFALSRTKEKLAQPNEKGMFSVAVRVESIFFFFFSSLPHHNSRSTCPRCRKV
jgi:hypothetical protein